MHVHDKECKEGSRRGGELGLFYTFQYMQAILVYSIHYYNNNKQNDDTSYPLSVTLHSAGTCVMSPFPCTMTSAGCMELTEAASSAQVGYRLPKIWKITVFKL